MNLPLIGRWLARRRTRKQLVYVQLLLSTMVVDLNDYPFWKSATESTSTVAELLEAP